MALVLTGIASANAQIVWGVRAGFAVPTVSGGEGSLSGKTALEAGPVMYYSFSDKLYLNPAVTFSIKSFGSRDDEISMYFAEVPVYLGYRVPLGKVDTYFQAGPYASFKISESENSGAEAFHAGLAVMYGVNIKRFKIEAGYKYGITSFVADTDIKMSSVFLGINYIF